MPKPDQDLANSIATLESSITQPTEGLPEDVFLFLTRITPMINVDLLIQNDLGQTLFTWRDDGYCPAGWHLPGGIIRYKETLAERIQAVARHELGTRVTFDPHPLAVNEIIHPNRRNRGHFVSLLHACKLLKPPAAHLKMTGDVIKPGTWAWQDRCLKNLLSVHEIYRPFF